MSAPDIGALRAIRARLLAFRRACDAVKVFMNAAESAALTADFGPSGDDRARRFTSGQAFVYVMFDFGEGTWSATAALRADYRPGQACVAHADTPTAAVHKALGGLAKTHPTEAAELRKAVTFKEAP